VGLRAARAKRGEASGSLKGSNSSAPGNARGDGGRLLRSPEGAQWEHPRHTLLRPFRASIILGTVYPGLAPAAPSRRPGLAHCAPLGLGSYGQIRRVTGAPDTWEVP